MYSLSIKYDDQLQTMAGLQMDQVKNSSWSLMSFEQVYVNPKGTLKTQGMQINDSAEVHITLSRTCRL